MTEVTITYITKHLEMSVGGIWSYINIIKLNCVNLYNKESGLCLLKWSAVLAVALQAFCIHSVVVLSSSQSQKGTPLLTLMKDPYIIIAAGKGVVVHSRCDKHHVSEILCFWWHWEENRRKQQPNREPAVALLVTQKRIRLQIVLWDECCTISPPK